MRMQRKRKGALPLARFLDAFNIPETGSVKKAVLFFFYSSIRLYAQSGCPKSSIAHFALYRTVIEAHSATVPGPAEIGDRVLPSRPRGDLRSRSGAWSGDHAPTSVPRRANQTAELDHTAVRTVGCHVVRLIQEPEPLPFVLHQTQVLRDVDLFLAPAVGSPEKPGIAHPPVAATSQPKVSVSISLRT